MLWCFGLKACKILGPQPGMESAPPVLEGEVLTTGPPGKSWSSLLLTTITSAELYFSD